MSKQIPWWKKGDADQSPDLNTAADELQRLSPSQGYLARQLARLFDLDREQDDQIAQLQATVKALAQMLTETGTLDGDQLQARLGKVAIAVEDRPPSNRGRRAAATVMGVPVGSTERREDPTAPSGTKSYRLTETSDKPTESSSDLLERLAAERMQLEAERARIESERRELESTRRAAERARAEHIETEQEAAEELRLERERLEALRGDLQRVEAQRLEVEHATQAEAERLETERRQAERFELEQLKAERLEAEARENKDPPDTDRVDSPEHPDEGGETTLQDSSLHESREAFFGTDYEPDPFSDSIYDDFDRRSSGRRGRIALLIIGLLLLFGGPALYFGVYKNPYVGDGPSELQVDRNTLHSGATAPKHETTSPKPKHKTVAGHSAGTKPGGTPGDKAVHSTPPSETPDTAHPSDKTGKGGQALTKTTAAPGTPTTDPRYAALIDQAKALFAKHRAGKAFKLLRKALKINPKGWEALERLAWRAYVRGAARRGRTLAKRALSENPQAPYAILVEAAAADERGRKSQARAGYQRFLSLCPACPERRDIANALRSL